MERRRFLQTIGTASTVTLVGLAGCGSPGGGAGETPEESPGVPADEPTPTGAGSPSPEGTPTEEGTPGQEGTPMEEGTPTEEGTPGEEGTPTADGTATPGDVQPIQMVTEGSEYYFDPIGLFVEPGTSVTWVNESGSHSSTAYVPDNPQAEVRRIPEDAEGWNSGILSESGAEFSHTFEVEGTYDYFCLPHKSLGMIGRIVVGAPGGPAVGSNPPDGELPQSTDIVEQGSIAWADFGGG